MTDETQPVEPPEEDDVFDAADQPETENDDEPARELTPVEQAQQFHDHLDQMKHWSRNTAQSIREERAVMKATGEATDDELTYLDQVVGLVSSVATRIEQGDSQRVRQP